MLKPTLVVIASLWIPCAALAQDLPELQTGNHVRLRLASGVKVAGVLEGQTAETLMLRGSPQSVRELKLDDVRGIEVSYGKHSRGRNAAIGAGVAVGVGVILGLLGDIGGGEECGDGTCTVYGALFGMAIAPVGALVGVAITPSDRWQPARLGASGPRLSLDRQRVSLGFAVRF